MRIIYAFFIVNIILYLFNYGRIFKIKTLSKEWFIQLFFMLKILIYFNISYNENSIITSNDFYDIILKTIFKIFGYFELFQFYEYKRTYNEKIYSYEEKIYMVLKMFFVVMLYVSYIKFQKLYEILCIYF